MFLKKIGLAAGGVALAAFGYVATAQAAPTDVNVYNGSGGALATNVSEFDWSSTGSGLAVGVGPFGSPLSVGQTFTFDYQSFLAAFVTANPVAPSLVTAGTGGAFSGSQYQFTAASTFTEQVSAILGGATPPNTVIFDAVPSSGTFSIFYDSTAVGGQAANVAAGTGFTDGIEVARFTIIGGTSTFTATSTSSGIGVGTITANLKVITDFVDPNYIQGIQGKVFDIEFQSTQNFPAGAQSTTSTFFGSGGSALYPSTSVTSNDILFKVDGSNTFSIPEPQTLLLFGIGLLMLGFVARRGTARAH